jgi:hypothetical protein
MSLDIRKDEQQDAQKAEDRTKDTKKYHQHSQACESMPWMDDAVRRSQTARIHGWCNCRGQTSMNQEVTKEEIL